MRTFNINDVYIDELLNTSKLPDIFKYRCIIRNNDILNEQFLNELARKINVTPSNLEIYHNWFLINDKYYYFKHYYIFEELLMEQIFKAFDVPNVNHKIVSFNGKAGIISENFRKQDCEYLNYEDVIPLEIDVPSHIIDYNSVIKTKMSDSDYQNYIELVSKIIAVDIMFGQFDHKYYNIMFEKSNTHLKLTPMFDNGCIFKEQASESTFVFKSCFDTLTFSLKSKNIDEHTIETINEYPELFKSLEATLNFNLTKIFNRLEQTYQLEIYKELRKQIQSYYDIHCKMVEKTLKHVK